MTLSASVAFWSENQVADLPLDITAEQSLAEMERRNAVYPGVTDLMPTAGFEGKRVLDFGCGPGHDVVGFLNNGAKFVYAVDVSPKAMAMTRARMEAHGWEDRCEALLLYYAPVPMVDHVHTAGVVHHVPNPAKTLRRLARSLSPDAEIRMMVYSSESDFYRRIAHGDPATFALLADGEAPITNAWTQEEVVAIADEAGLSATYVGSYRHPGEVSGPGLSSCWTLR